MSIRKVVVLTGAICLAVSGLVFPLGIPEPNIPNLNNDEIVDFDDFAILAGNWRQSGAKLPGDLDDNGTIDTYDLIIFCWYWLVEYSEYQQCQSADLDSDGIIAFEDVAELARNWLKTGEGFIGDFDDSNSVDFSDLYILAECWLKGSRPEIVWEQFKAALLEGDVDKAVSYFTEVSAENYRTFLEQLRPYFPQMVNDMGELIFIRFDSDMVVYDLLREENGQTYGYPVVFIRDEMSQWKIYDF